MKSKLLWLSVVLFILGSCASSNTVSNGFITKRKHNKGFHINLNKNKNNVAVNKNSNKKFIKRNDESDITQNDEKVIFSADNGQDYAFASLNNEVEIKDKKKSNSNESSLDFMTAKKSTKPATRSKIKRKPKYSTVSNKTNFEATNKIKEKYKIESNNLDDETILLVILCFFLPPLAVYFHEGKNWTTRCWINLILTLIFFIPGVIHGLIVVLE